MTEAIATLTDWLHLTTQRTQLEVPRDSRVTLEAAA